MSRIGKQPIVIPEKVKVNIGNGEVKVEGPLGPLSMRLPEGISASSKEGKILVEITGSGDARKLNMLHGTVRARLANMVRGVTNGFEKVLELNGLGYKAQVAGAKLNMELGFSHPVLFDIPPGIKIEVDPKQTMLTIKGSDNMVVGDVAAMIRRIRPPEPYKGSGIKYQGEHIARKAGKTAVSTKK